MRQLVAQSLVLGHDVFALTLHRAALPAHLAVLPPQPLHLLLVLLQDLLHVLRRRGARCSKGYGQRTACNARSHAQPRAAAHPILPRAHAYPRSPTSAQGHRAQRVPCRRVCERSLHRLSVHACGRRVQRGEHRAAGASLLSHRGTTHDRARCAGAGPRRLTPRSARSWRSAAAARGVRAREWQTSCGGQTAAVATPRRAAWAAANLVAPRRGCRRDSTAEARRAQAQPRRSLSERTQAVSLGTAPSSHGGDKRTHGGQAGRASSHSPCAAVECRCAGSQSAAPWGRPAAARANSGA